MSHNAFIIVAAGQGARMGAPLPKQYLHVEGQPVLAHTLDHVATLLRPEDQLILVIPPDDDKRVRRLLGDYCPGLEVTIAHGGATRTESVRHGLALVAEGTERVAIHDGVRPFVTPGMWQRLTAALGECEAVIPVVEPTDSLREVDEKGESHPLDRSRIRCVQTPQLFRYQVIKEAYDTLPEGATQTDDAGVYSLHTGRSPRLVEGDVDNIKITTPRDLATAAWILRDL